MRIIEIDGELDPDLEELLLVSGRVMTEEQMKRKIILRALDPMIPSGLPFEFEDRPEDDPTYLSLEVPEIGADVDLAVAWQYAQQDAAAGALILEQDNSLAATIRVYKSCLDWLAFWSHRHPNAVARDQFGRQLEQRRENLRQLKHKAKYELKFGMTEALAELK
jgi:hypothetical protein